MVWEQRCNTVVMATKLVEDNRDKCAKYWPDAGRQIKSGGFIIKGVDTKHMDGYVLNTLQISAVKVRSARACNNILIRCDKKHIITPPDPSPSQCQGPQRPRTVQHYWITSWPDHGVPDATRPITAMMLDIRTQNKDAVPAPVIVHCSAGCGLSLSLFNIHVFIH